MATNDYPTELPPRPDSKTGQPNPPAAPAQFAEGYNEKPPSRMPAPPQGNGPTLAVYRQKRYMSWLGGLIPVGVLVICFLVYDGLKGIELWPIWLILAAVYAWTVYVNRANIVTAGSDWVMGGRKYWVNTYELTQIHIRSYGVNHPGLFLADQERTVEISLGLLQANRKLWDYVHLGMRHSRSNGSEINMAARSVFPELASTNLNSNSEKD